MGWLNKLFGKEDHNTPFSANPHLQQIRFGRYSDNNKSVAKTKRWYDAENLFKEKKHLEAFTAFFDYLRDEIEDNVHFQANGDQFTFELVQGSKKIQGSSNGKYITAQVPVIKMRAPSPAVMRRMLELNYGLYYTRTALSEDQVISIIFDTTLPAANPNKLYYGLKELATKADRQDDVLLFDFPMLEAIGNQHTEQLPDTELEVKYNYFRKWIEDTLNRITELNADSFSGAIAYLLLNLLYRIDYLIAPEGKLLSQLEKINGLYWLKKEEIPVIDRNRMMQEELRALLLISKEEFCRSVYRAKATFAVTSPPKSDKLKETIDNSNRDSYWYVENKYPDLALILNEYGLSYNQYTFSMPSVITEFFHLYMMVLHADYFAALGWERKLYHADTNQFDKAAVQQKVIQICSAHKEKFPYLGMDAGKLKFDNLYHFIISFSDQIGSINLEPPKAGENGSRKSLF